MQRAHQINDRKPRATAPAPAHDGIASGRLAPQGWWQAVGRFTRKLARAGTQGYPPDVQRRLVVMNLIAYLIAATTLGFALQHAQLNFAKYEPVIYLNLLLVMTAVAVPFSHRISELAGGLIIVISEYAALITFTAYLGRDAGIHLQYFIAPAATFVVFGLDRLRLIIPLIVIGVVLHLLAWFQFPTEKALIQAEPEVIANIYMQAAVTTGALIAASVYYAFSLAEAARAETDALLRNILPDTVVERLKARPGEAVSDNIEEASILFADISGFVALARKLGAERIVELLDDLVSEFDALAEQHGVEKIKTIGDAYMAAAGIPQPAPDHTQRLVRMALDMLAVIERVRHETGLELHVRVGVASGSVMAGVIGTRKFSYDVWGDAVNLAARLENKSEPGRILVCPNCHKNLAGLFDLEARGAIEIKGVGPKETWFVVGEKAGS